MRQRFVILEGPNRVGKTTVRPLISEGLGHRGDHVIDRFVGSYFMFDRIRRSRGALRTGIDLLDELHFLEERYQVMQVTLIHNVLTLEDRGNKNAAAQLALCRQWNEITQRAGYMATTVWAGDAPQVVAERVVRWVNGHALAS